MYASSTAAAAACGQYSARLATLDQVHDAYKGGSQVCAWGYTATTDSSGVSIVAFPMQSPDPGCGDKAGVIEKAAYTEGWNNGVVGAACYGIKPPKGTPNIQPWNGNLWSSSDSGWFVFLSRQRAGCLAA